MASLIDNATGLIIGVVGVIVVAAIIATTNAETVGTTAFLVLGFVTVGMAVGLLIIAFKG